jgi:uncharacterized RDD family membrane protein YckC
MKKKDKLIYSSFKSRFLASVLDAFIIGMPFTTLKASFQNSKLVFIFEHVLMALIFQSIYIFFLTKYGATPGKMILKISVKKLDGSQIKIKEAFLRYSVEIIYALSFSIIFIVTYDSNFVDSFLATEGEEKRKMYDILYPKWKWIVGYIMSAYGLSEAFVALCNKKRRAIHDYIAGTIVINNKL